MNDLTAMTHADPAEETSEKLARYGAAVVMAAEALAVIGAARSKAQATQDERAAHDGAEAARSARAVQGKIDAARQAASQLWAPVLDDQRRSSMDVGETLTAWAATQAWRPERDAEKASTAAEDRLRELRPDAMAAYDRARENGQDPIAAMRSVVPIFERNVRVGDPTPHRPELATTRTLEEPPAELVAAMREHEEDADHQHRVTQHQRTAGLAHATTPNDPRTPAIDEHAAGLAEARPHFAAASVAHGHELAERSAAAALAASYPAPLRSVQTASTTQTPPPTPAPTRKPSIAAATRSG